jgi:hypothetical protein
MFPHELTTNDSILVTPLQTQFHETRNLNHTHTTISYVSITEAHIWRNKRPNFRPQLADVGGGDLQPRQCMTISDRLLRVIN